MALLTPTFVAADILVADIASSTDGAMVDVNTGQVVVVLVITTSDNGNNPFVNDTTYDGEVMTELAHNYDLTGDGLVAAGAWYHIATEDHTLGVVSSGSDFSVLAEAAVVFSFSGTVGSASAEDDGGADDAASGLGSFWPLSVTLPAVSGTLDPALQLALVAGQRVSSNGTTALPVPTGWTSRGTATASDSRARVLTRDDGSAPWASETFTYTCTDTTVPNDGAELSVFGVALQFEEAVSDPTNISPDRQLLYERIQVTAKELPYYIDSGFLRGLD